MRYLGGYQISTFIRFATEKPVSSKLFHNVNVPVYRKTSALIMFNKLLNIN